MQEEFEARLAGSLTLSAARSDGAPMAMVPDGAARQLTCVRRVCACPVWAAIRMPIAMAHVIACQRTWLSRMGAAPSVRMQAAMRHMTAYIRIWLYRMAHVTGGCRYDRRGEFCEWLVGARLGEGAAQAAAVKAGLASVVPMEVLRLMTGPELELAVCGRPAVDVEMLRRHTVYARARIRMWLSCMGHAIRRMEAAMCHVTAL